MEERRKSHRFRNTLLVGAAVGLAWFLFAPSTLSERVLKRVILAKLNLPEQGLVCDSAEVRLAPRRDHFAEIRLRGRLWGCPFHAQAAADLKVFALTLSGRGRAALLAEDGTDSPYAVGFGFSATPLTWNAAARVDSFRFASGDRPAAAALARFAPAMTNLAFSGTFALSATAEKTRETPVPVWEAKVPLDDVRATLTTGDGRAVALDGLRTSVRASGIARHLDIAPILVHAPSVEAAGFTLSNVFASVQTSGDRFLVSEAGADACGGQIRVYALRLDPEKLSAGFTLSLEGVDTAQVLTHFRDLDAEASGRLHGRVKLAVRNGKRVRLSDAYLYSYPGETGKLQVRSKASASELLAFAGLDDATRANIAEVLTDVDYDVLKLDLSREDGTSAALSVKVEGSATRGKVTVPVSLQVTLHGELEQLINTGLKLSGK